MSIGLDATNPFVSAVTTTTTIAPSARLDSLGNSLSVRNFEDALRAANGPAMPELRLAQADATLPVPGSTATDAVAPLVSADAVPPVTEVTPGTEADARLRAAEGLGLEPGKDVGPGGSILSGLEQLRGVFDNQYSSMDKTLKGVTMESESLLQLQADLVEYSVLVDVSSKLAGKVTTAIDSLMKGQ